MADQSQDVLMRVVNRGRALQAESGTVFAVNRIIDGLRADFDPGQFCELREFNFSVGVGSAFNTKIKKDATDEEKLEAERLDKLRERQSRAQVSRGTIEPIDMQPVTFTRIFDTASTLLFKSLVNCETIDSLSIIKRKAAGTINSGLVYLRLDFTKVLMTELEWKDAEHFVEETGTFIYRELTIRYRSQKPDGTLGSVIPMSWTMKANT